MKKKLILNKLCGFKLFNYRPLSRDCQIGATFYYLFAYRNIIVWQCKVSKCICLQAKSAKKSATSKSAKKEDKGGSAKKKDKKEGKNVKSEKEVSSHYFNHQDWVKWSELNWILYLPLVCRVALTELTCWHAQLTASPLEPLTDGWCVLLVKATPLPQKVILVWTSVTPLPTPANSSFSRSFTNLHVLSFPLCNHLHVHLYLPQNFQ